MSLTITSIYANCSKSDGCRIWKGSVTGQGYPHVYDPERNAMGLKQHMVMVRRRVFELSSGPIPAGHKIIMKCRNKLCVGRGCMEAADAKEAREFAKAGGSYDTLRCRVARSVSARRNARFTWEQAEAIRARGLAGESRLGMAVEFGVHRNVIDRIVTGERYVRKLATNSSVFHMAAAA